jgi:uncharacterized protein (DUF927 family)
MISLPADAGAGFGVFQKLHGSSTSAALAEHLRVAASTYCGTAGRAYLNQLARERADDPEVLVKTLRALCEQFLHDHVPEGADGQVHSVAKRFALIAAGGELATAYDITGWPDREALRAAGACFKHWLSARGGTGAAEAMRAVEQARAFIAAHGPSRFERTDDLDQQKIINRAGWKLREGEGWNYFITTDCWRTEVSKGLNPTNAADAVHRAGFLVRDDDKRRTVVRRIAQHGTPRGYLVRGTILGGDNGE